VAKGNQTKNHSAHKSRKTFNGLGYQLVDNDVQEGTQQRMIIQTRIETDIVGLCFQNYKIGLCMKFFSQSWNITTWWPKRFLSEFKVRAFQNSSTMNPLFLKVKEKFWGYIGS